MKILRSIAGQKNLEDRRLVFHYIDEIELPEIGALRFQNLLRKHPSSAGFLTPTSVSHEFDGYSFQVRRLSLPNLARCAKSQFTNEGI